MQFFIATTNQACLPASKHALFATIMISHEDVRAASEGRGLECHVDAEGDAMIHQVILRFRERNFICKA